MREGSRYTLLLNNLFAVSLCRTFHPVMHFPALLFAVCARPRTKIDVKEMVLAVLLATEISKTVKPVRTPVAIFGSLGVCIYVPASRHSLISYSPIHLT